MRQLSGLALGVLLAMAAGDARATLMSVSNEALPQGSNLATCLQRGAQAIAAMGMQPLNPTSAASWGQRDGGRIFSVYCMPDRNAAVVIGAGPDGQEVGPDVTNLAAAFRNTGATRPLK